MGLLEKARSITRAHELTAALFGVSESFNPFDSMLARVDIELAQLQPLKKSGLCSCGSPATLSSSKGKQPGADYCERCWTLDVLPLCGGEG